MSRMLTVGFNYLNDLHYSILLVKEHEDEIEYKITIMNGPLQSMITGYNIIRQRNGCLYVDNLKCEEIKCLKVSIAEALGDLLQLPVQAELPVVETETWHG